jgi:threonine dehydratase
VDVSLPTLAGIERAHRALEAGVRDTPLVRSELLSRGLNADVWLKNETVGPVASFKARGALTAVLRARKAGEVR